MDKIYIKPINQCGPEAFPEVARIFFQTSSVQNFSSTEAKYQFQFKYLDFYFHHYKEFFFVAHDQKNVLGYIVGCPHTLDQPLLWSNQQHLVLFEDLYVQYPAHLHINLDEKARGRGVGSLLIQHLEKILIEMDIPGLHLITTPNARNVTFYLKNNYNRRVERLLEGKPLLFMGKIL